LNHLISLPTPKNISYFFNFGSLLGLFLGVQIVSGIFLSLFYNVNTPFEANDFIMRDLFGGWLVRFVHCNGATMYFLLIYLHIFRGMYYQSYSRTPRVWLIGCSIYVLSMAVAFLGYVLPWGNMSYWGATVIINLFSSIPIIGGSLVQMIWGDYSVSLNVVNRFFSLHFLLPFLVAIMVILHLLFLHNKGSTNPLNLNSDGDKIPFSSFYISKDFWFFFLFLFIFFYFIWWVPYVFMGYDNFFIANPLFTPNHIEPEWYFLAPYAMLRSIPNKLGGVVALALSIIILFFLPFFNTVVNNNFLESRLYLSFFCFVFLILTWNGHNQVEPPYFILGGVFTVFYFLFFLLPLFFNLNNNH
uniref:cytochrome b n=1 Tax=Miroplana shenzhensis TaxID=2597322 RepID=UPI001FAE7F0C